VAVPQGAPQRSGTIKLMPAQRAAEAQRAPEPDMPRMGREGLARTNQQRSQVPCCSWLLASAATVLPQCCHSAATVLP
jgi:hypothetical protein